MEIPERDWKILRRVHAAALDRFCRQILGECEALLDGATGPAHERYLELYGLLKERDRSLARAFDDMRRSRAMDRLVAMMELGVVTDDELQEFSAHVREMAQRILTSRTAIADD